jgi:hypothetical protein
MGNTTSRTRGGNKVEKEEGCIEKGGGGCRGRGNQERRQEPRNRKVK